MSEMSFETRAEETIKTQLSDGAGVVKAVFEGVKGKKDEPEEEGFMDIVILATKIKANTILRRMIRHY